jgi:hypothetical protein
MKHKVFLLSLVVIALAIVPGCARTVATQSGAYEWQAGKLMYTAQAPVEPTHNAVLAAFNQLGINLISDETSMLGGTIKGVAPETNEDITVDLEPKGDNLTQIEIRVGFFGNQGVSENIADTIKQNLG